MPESRPRPYRTYYRLSTVPPTGDIFVFIGSLRRIIESALLVYRCDDRCDDRVSADLMILQIRSIERKYFRNCQLCL